MASSSASMAHTCRGVRKRGRGFLMAFLRCMRGSPNCGLCLHVAAGAAAATAAAAVGTAAKASASLTAQGCRCGPTPFLCSSARLPGAVFCGDRELVPRGCCGRHPLPALPAFGRLEARWALAEAALLAPLPPLRASHIVPSPRRPGPLPAAGTSSVLTSTSPSATRRTPPTPTSVMPTSATRPRRAPAHVRAP